MSYNDYDNGKLDGYNEGYADGRKESQTDLDAYKSILSLVLSLFNSIPAEIEDPLAGLRGRDVR